MLTCEDHDNCVVVSDKNHCPICKLERELKDSEDHVRQLQKDIEHYEELLNRE